MKKCFLGIAFFIFGIVLSQSGAGASPLGRVLVLGFDSSHLNDVQDRFLRESTLREFHKKGFPIVSIMRLESIFYKGSGVNIRKISLDKIREYSREFSADYVVSGKLFLKGKKGERGDIRKGNSYICEITLYQRSCDKFTKIEREVPGRDNFYDFNTELAALIVKGVLTAVGD